MSRWSRGMRVVAVRVMSVVQDGYWGRVAGWVYRVGNTGTYPVAICPRAEVPQPASDCRERALPCRGRVGWKQVGTDPFACPSTRNPRTPPLRGPVAAPRAPGPWGSLGAPRSKRARFHVISWKVSEDGKVSPKSVEKAWHSPYIPKRGRKVTS